MIADALALQREATGQGLIQHAKELGQSGDYIGGGKELKQALQSLPENAEAKQLVVDFQQHVPEQMERMRVERLARPKKVFDITMASNGGTFGFTSHELTPSKSAADVQLLIEMQLKTEQPYFQIVRSDMTNEVFRISARQEFPGGIRQCEIVGGRARTMKVFYIYGSKVVFEAVKSGQLYSLAVVFGVSMKVYRESSPIRFWWTSESTLSVF
jgi:hypothetical protein